jgi:hypothetical protein
MTNSVEVFDQKRRIISRSSRYESTLVHSLDIELSGRDSPNTCTVSLTLACSYCSNQDELEVDLPNCKVKVPGSNNKFKLEVDVVRGVPVDQCRYCTAPPECDFSDEDTVEVLSDSEEGVLYLTAEQLETKQEEETGEWIVYIPPAAYPPRVLPHA